MGQSQYQEQARQEQENAIGALRGAAMQNYYNALSTGLGAATTLYGMGQKGSGSGVESDATLQGVRQNVSDISTTPDAAELGNMGGSPSILTPTPEMAGLEGSNSTLLNNSMPNPYYVPQPYGTAESNAYKNMLARKRYVGDTFK